MIDLDKNKHYLLACSFGPDSMALFDMLEKEKYHFSAALVNYHLREESDAEMKAFISYCEEHKITYHTKEVNSGFKGKNIEAECRRIRYEFFAELTRVFHYDATLVAHNEDDLIETYILQKKRQNLVNFYGIKEKNVINGINIIRPLLMFEKAQLLKYCNDNNVPYSIDSSNLEDTYLRNQVRHQIVEKMNRENRDEILNEINAKNAILESVQNKLSAMDIHDVKNLLSLNDIELAYAINYLVKDEAFAISLKQVKEIKKVLLKSEGNVDIPLKNNVLLRKSYDCLEVVVPRDIEYEYVISKPCEFDCEYFYLNFLGDTSNRNVKIDSYPLTIRNYKKGDTYQIKNYFVSVRRLFIDWKMPLSLRKRWPIIINKEGKIIYIPRYQKSFKVDKTVNFYVK